MLIQEVKLGNFTQKAIKLTQNQSLSPECQKIPTEDLNFFLTLHEKTKTQPKKVLNELTDFLIRYPIVPEVLSLMAYNYIQRNKIKRADETIAFNYKHNPDNLLVKVNYADVCLRQRKNREIDEIFEGTYDLQELYPDKEEFYFEDYRAFHVVLGHYFFDSKENERAEGHLLLASNIQPKHHSVIFLAKKIYKKKRTPILSLWKKESQKETSALNI